MPYHRRLQLCFALLALSTAGCSGAPRSSPILTGTLVVTVKPADGITPTVIITGPNAYSKTITSTQTIGNLPIGDYNITADSVAHPDSIVGTVVDTAFVSGNPVSLQTGDTAKVTVTYATERRTGGLWIANNAYGTIPDYASAQLRAGGALVAAETLATAAGGPAGIALDPQSNLWVSDFTSDSVFMYSRAAIDGDSSTPSKVIVDSIIQSANNIAFDPQGDLWVADGDGFLFEYTPTQLAAGGKQNAVLQISGPELGVPYALTFDPYGNLWVADQGYNHIVEYSESQLGGTGPSCTPPPAVQCAPTPVDTIGANANSINTPSGLAFDSKGDLWVANSSGGTIVEFTPAQITSNGGPTPQVTITAPTGAVLNGLAIDNSSSVWVTSAPGGLSGAIYAFTAAQLATSGSPAPSVTITGTLKFFTPAQLLFDPGSIAEAPSAAVVRNAHLHASTVGRLNPSLARALHRR